MPYPLQMVFLMNFVQVYSQTCYEKCVQEANTGITNLTIMVADASWRSSSFSTTMTVARQEDHRVQQFIPGDFRRVACCHQLDA